MAAQIKSIALSLNTRCIGPIPLPTRKMSQTTRKTPCSDGSHTFERWELRVHKRLIIVDGDDLKQIMRIRVPDMIQIKISLVN